MSETLEWYAKRGLLTASDEDNACNDDRLKAGRWLVRQYARGQSSQGQIAQYKPEVRAKGARPDQLNRMEADVDARLAITTALASLPPRTRACVEQVCLADARVGKPMMERLRCGLDALAQNVIIRKNKC